MKRLFLVAAALAFVGVNAMADDVAAPGMKWGVQGGLNFAGMSTNPDVANKGTATGIIAGVFADWGLSDMLVLRPEVNFIQKGFKVTGAGTTRANYIEVPVQLKAHWNFGGIKPYVLAGPAIGFLMSANSTPEGGGTSQDQKSNYKSIDLGIDLGAGAALAVAETVDVFLTLKYGIGLANVSNLTGYTAKNNGLQLLVGLAF